MQSIYWIRSDLRIHDNVALNNFCELSKKGLLIWCPTSSYLRAESIRKSFNDECLTCFSEQLKKYGLSLTVKNKKMPCILSDLIATYKIDHIFWTKEFSVEEIKEENAVIEICNQSGITFTALDQVTLIKPADLPFEIKNMPFVFTDFRKSIEKNLSIRAPVSQPTVWPEQIKIQNDAPEISLQKTIYPPGELAGIERLHHYLWDSKAVETYKITRNGMLDLNDSSKFSPWLNLGCLSPRLIYQELKSYEAKVVENESTYWLFFELLWRDYFKFFSLKFGQKVFLEQGIKTDQSSPANRNLKLFENWCNGETDEKFIDANMNELNQTGWMSNRGRQNVASYLIHDLNLPWVWGASYFEKKLIDYDPDLNWGNWLYLSGKGSDPRARKFNIPKQAMQYDPYQTYQNKWATK